MVHLIGARNATCTQRVLTVLAEKGVTDYTLYTIALMKGEQKQATYIAKQPFGLIPLLEDGDLTVFESRAISRYLAGKYSDQGTKLVPDQSDIKANALLDQWLSVETNNWDVFASEIVNQKLYRIWRGLQTVPEVLNAALESFNQKLDIFETVLGKQKYMGGDEFSVVDIFYLPNTAKLFEVGEGTLITSRPNLNAWWVRVSTRDSWKKVCTDALA